MLCVGLINVLIMCVFGKNVIIKRFWYPINEKRSFSFIELGLNLFKPKLFYNYFFRFIMNLSDQCVQFLDE